MANPNSKNRNPLRRLRILQILAEAQGGELPAPAILTLLRSNPELDPDMQMTLRSLIWLEDKGLADVRVVDGDEAVTFARITDFGVAFLNADRNPLRFIAHPTDFLQEDV